MNGYVNVLGVAVDAVDLPMAASIVRSAIVNHRRGYVCVTGVHGIMEAQRDLRFRDILNRSILVTPDGMPTVWIGRMQGCRQIKRVFGPELMLEVCRVLLPLGATHYLYGGAPGVAEQLQHVLKTRFPGIRVVGSYTPPFRPLTRDEFEILASSVQDLKPDVMWVGVSTPRQEYFMAENLSRLDTTVMLGVGAAFDFVTGRISDSPNWIKNSGLQWAHRLLQDPRRLWKRYFFNNPAFVYRAGLQAVGMRRYTLTRTPQSSQT